jgi:LmbE family N-acetylglucosaminyl deacetylase
MFALQLPPTPLQLLCLGAHADDIEIGCGGTVLRLLAEHPGSGCRWIVFSGIGEREREAHASAALFMADAAERQVDVHDFRDGHFPALLSGIKDTLEEAKRDFAPDVVFTHFRDDRHQDHRTVSEVTWQTFRNHLILEYEIPKWDGDLGRPGLYVPLPSDTVSQKLGHLLAAFPSQRSKHWFSEDTFRALMRLRGVECAAGEGYAEAFHAFKSVMDVAGRGR